MYYTREFFQKMLDDFERNLEMSKKELSRCPQDKLYIEMRAGKPFFFLATADDETWKRNKLTASTAATPDNGVEKRGGHGKCNKLTASNKVAVCEGAGKGSGAGEYYETGSYTDAQELIDNALTGNRKPRARRRAINKDTELIYGLLRQQYLQAQCNVLEKDAELLKALATEFVDTIPTAYFEQMPKRFRILTQSEEKKIATIATIPLTSILTGVTVDEDLDAWASAKFEQNPYKPEQRTFITSRGLGVRSKSEQLISEKFYEFDVPFRYEQLLSIGEHLYYPDFTARNRRTGKLLYWEHFGMVNDVQYMKKRRAKLEAYEMAGIVPWDNFIATYDDAKGGLDMQYVEYMIKYWLL